MAKFNVGDVLTSIRFPDKPRYEVIVVEEGYGSYRLTCNGMPAGTHRIAYIDSVLKLITPANPNLITVSSLDYMMSTTLTDEDKLIIMEHLEHA